MSQPHDPALNAVHQAQLALQRGDRREARRWAEQAVALAPDREDGWLALAALASPRGSLTYLQRALEINPSSPRARQGMDWALRRLRQAGVEPASSPEAASGTQPVRTSSAGMGGTQPVHVSARTRDTQPVRTGAARTTVLPLRPEALARPRPALLPWALALLLLLGGLAAWFGSPDFTLALGKEPLSLAQIGPEKATLSPTPTATFTSTPTATPTETPTATPTATFIPTETPTATPTATAMPEPTRRAKKKKKNPPVVAEDPGPVSRPGGVSLEEPWVDVDLSAQRAYAYQGDTLVRSFVVSTGTWLHPTVTGTFRVYVRYRYADMYGPDYYLPNVPYVMYFYKGYGLHGTYWHNNFGTPMSHGCVNFSIDDAGWLFDFTTLGTVVNVHN